MIGPNNKRKKMKWKNSKLPSCHRCGHSGLVVDKETGKKVGCRGCRGTGTSL